ncbi:unnamed protein product [Arabis nemorensis]|uniref:Jacalin-type lectin domain-containing protein n=1 Tax=Arabis nemorensis TaxID=586526 RepID=A0A565BH70_9BRAS|nr:unnamed protein product [Arabis nemorensis]
MVVAVPESSVREASVREALVLEALITEALVPEAFVTEDSVAEAIVLKVPPFWTLSRILHSQTYFIGYVFAREAYFVPITLTPLKPGVRKLDAIGGDEGVVWDDGVFDDVRKIDIGDYENGVSHFKTEYNKDSKPISHQHGKDSMVPHEEEGHKIVGFHGKIGDTWVHQIGVYVAPITN